MPRLSRLPPALRAAVFLMPSAAGRHSDPPGEGFPRPSKGENAHCQGGKRPERGGEHNALAAESAAHPGDEGKHRVAPSAFGSARHVPLYRGSSILSCAPAAVGVSLALAPLATRMEWV